MASGPLLSMFITLTQTLTYTTDYYIDVKYEM